MTEEDLEEYAKAAPVVRKAAADRQKSRPNTAPQPLTEDQKKRMCRELFGDSDDDDDDGGVEYENGAPRGDSPPPPRDGQTQTYVDPTTALMDSGNMEAMLPPTVATKTCPYPFRLRDYVCGWNPSGGYRGDGGQIWCWYDGHPVEGRPFRLPWFKDARTGAYHVMGYFCGPGCARAFNACEFGRDRTGTVRRDALAVELAVTCYGYSPCCMPRAPNRLLLREYGGPLGIDEFRSYSVDGGGSCGPQNRRITLEYPYVVVSQIVREHTGEKDSDYRRTFMQAAEPAGASAGRKPPTKRSAAAAAAALEAVASDAWTAAEIPELGEVDRYRISMWKRRLNREALAAPMRKRMRYNDGGIADSDGGGGGGGNATADPGRPKRRRSSKSKPAETRSIPPPPTTAPPQTTNTRQTPSQPPATPQITQPPPTRNPQTTNASPQSPPETTRPPSSSSPIARPPERDGYRSLRDLFHRR